MIVKGLNDQNQFEGKALSVFLKLLDYEHGLVLDLGDAFHLAVYNEDEIGLAHGHLCFEPSQDDLWTGAPTDRRLWIAVARMGAADEDEVTESG